VSGIGLDCPEIEKTDNFLNAGHTNFTKLKYILSSFDSCIFRWYIVNKISKCK